jgi:hypothetical protein
MVYILTCTFNDVSTAGVRSLEAVEQDDGKHV